MSRSSSKLITEKKQVDPRANTGKRDRSLSMEIIPKKRTKLGSEPKPMQPKPASAPVEHLRAWLAHASDTEVNNLTDFLVRKRKKESGATYRPADTTVNAIPAIKVAGQMLEKWRSIPKSSGTFSRPPPMIRSSITKQDIDDAYEALYPKRAPVKTKKKLFER